MIVAPVFRLSGLPASELKRTNLPPPVTFPNFQMENIRFVDRIVVLSGERKANKKATDRSVALKGSLSGYRDSNSGPPTPEAGALTGLRYIPKTCRTNFLFLIVGVTRFELVTPCSQSRCANRTAPHPEVVRNQFPNRFRCAKIHAFLVITNFSARKIVLPVGCRRRAVRNRLSSSAPYSCRAKPRSETVQRWKRIVKRRIRRVTKSGM